MMAQEGHSPVLVSDSPVLIFTQSSFNFDTVLFYFFLHAPVLFFV